MATQKNRAAQYVKSVRSGNTGFDTNDKIMPLYNNDQAERAAQFVKNTSSGGGAWAPANADKLAPAGSYTVSTFRSTIPGASAPFDYSKKTAYQRALDDVLNPKPYSYDVLSDPLYTQYRDQYRREGDRAMRDTLGEVSARTGGLASSYATTAAQQANQVYLDRLNDVVPQLEQQAYNRYLQEQQARAAGLNALSDDYAREYNIWQDALNRETAMEKEAYTRQQAAEQEAYKRQQADKEFAQRQVDAILAAGGTPSSDLLLASGYGNPYADTIAAETARLRAQEDEKAQRDAADWLAGYYDYSGLEGAGVDTTYMRALRDAQMGAGGGASSGGGGRSGSGGSGRSGSGSGSGATADGNTKWTDAEAWLDQYGTEAAENYIKAHYKELGYSAQSAALADWNLHLLEIGGGAGGSDNSFELTRNVGILNDPRTVEVENTGKWGKGSGYDNALNTAKSMAANGASPETIAAYLDGMSEKQLTDAGIKKIYKAMGWV